MFLFIFIAFTRSAFYSVVRKKKKKLVINNFLWKYYFRNSTKINLFQLKNDMSIIFRNKFEVRLIFHLNTFHLVEKEYNRTTFLARDISKVKRKVRKNEKNTVKKMFLLFWLTDPWFLKKSYKLDFRIQIYIFRVKAHFCILLANYKKYFIGIFRLEIRKKNRNLTTRDRRETCLGGNDRDDLEIW